VGEDSVSIRDRVGSFVAETRWETLPREVREQARRCLVDTLGATLAGTLTRVSEITSGFAVETWPGHEATILLRGQRCGAVGAAFANGWAANSLDIDDGLRYAYGHGGAQIFATALAVAEARGLDGKRMLAGMVVGYEVAHRVGRCWHDSREVYQACGSWGSVASAATAANLLDLNSQQVWEALGIAEYHAPNAPMMRDVDNPAMVKHATGWGTMTGVTSAQLAARGFTGIPSMLGFETYKDSVKEIGDDYLMVGGVAWKQKGYACCSWAHAAARGARELLDEHGIAPEAIDRIVVEGFHETVRLGTELPTTTEEAQFNVAWPVAAMVLDGEIGPAQTLEERLSDPELRALARKVSLVESEELNELVRLYEKGDPRGRFASRVAIHLADGRVVRSGLVDEGSKFPNPVWERERMEEKFRWVVGSVLDEAGVARVLEVAWQVDALGDVGELVEVCEGGGGSPQQS